MKKSFTVTKNRNSRDNIKSNKVCRKRSLNSISTVDCSPTVSSPKIDQCNFVNINRINLQNLYNAIASAESHEDKINDGSSSRKLRISFNEKIRDVAEALCLLERKVDVANSTLIHDSLADTNTEKKINVIPEFNDESHAHFIFGKNINIRNKRNTSSSSVHKTKVHCDNLVENEVEQRTIEVGTVSAVKDKNELTGDNVKHMENKSSSNDVLNRKLSSAGNHLKKSDYNKESFHSVHSFDELSHRARKLLSDWRKNIQIEDTLYCPDYMDEYECNDLNRKWVKLYPCNVIHVERGPGGKKITLGDSSKKSKQTYLLRTNEIAIRVHYHNFPKCHDRWLLLSENHGVHIMPYGSTDKSVNALKKYLSNSTKNVYIANSNASKGGCSGQTLPSEKGDSLIPKKVFANNVDTIQVNGFNEDALSVNTSNLDFSVNGIKTDIDEVTPRENLGENKKSRQFEGKFLKNEGIKKTDTKTLVHEDSRGKSSREILERKRMEIDKIMSITVENRAPKVYSSVLKEKETRKAGGKLRIIGGKRKKDDMSGADTFTWICAACREAECAVDPNSPLLICEGTCRRVFHYPCAGLNFLPRYDQPWICSDCLGNKHLCAACSQYGVDNEDVFKCSKKNCGLFFHEGCLSMYGVDINYTPSDVEGIERTPRFVCPAHQCWTCSSGYPIALIGQKKEKKKQFTQSSVFREKKGDLFRCLDCAIAFHSTCIPPKAKFHELALLCHEHAKSSKLPKLDTSSSIQAQIEASIDKKLEKYRKINIQTMNVGTTCTTILNSSNAILSHLTSLPQSNQIDSKTLLTNTDTFRLPFDFREEVHSKPPVYTTIHSLRYDSNNRPKRHPPNEPCNCTPLPNDDKSGRVSCDENCLNRMLMIECVGQPKKPLNPYTNCRCGPHCGNRSLSKREFAKCKPKRESGRGWGLMLLDNVKKGSLVQEYVGEVVDEKEKKARLEQWSIDHPNDPNFYMMKLESGWYIDARKKGNLSRFINHSCDPNCSLVPKNVAGFIRVAIIANRDMAAGEFLSYDYQFDTKDGDRFVCRCGSLRCRGTMKGGARQKEHENKVAKKSLKQMKMEAKAKLDRDQKYLAQVAIDQNSRLNEVGLLVPGGLADEMNIVANGPQLKDKDYARNHRIFLWRNAIIGGNFNARYWRLCDKNNKNVMEKNSQKHQKQRPKNVRNVGDIFTN